MTIILTVAEALFKLEHVIPVSTPRELPEIKSRTNDGPEIGRALSRVRENFSSNFTSTLDVIVQIVDQLPHSIRYLQ
ncbi:hypothetical protein ACKLNR_003491 [Fusarium oxysporum f. sp. zingiberi]